MHTLVKNPCFRVKAASMPVMSDAKFLYVMLGKPYEINGNP